MKYSSFRPAATLAACTFVLALAACGGGGGDSSSEAAPTIKSVDVAAFMHNRLRANATWTMSGTGTAKGQSTPVQIALAMASASPAAFPLTGVTGNTSVQTMTVSASGASTPITRTYYYDDADHTFGASYSTGGCSTVSASPTALPIASAIGSSGALETLESYVSCTASASNIAVATATETWSVENDGEIVFVCENMTQGIGSGASSGSTCIESDANGKLGSRARLTISASGTTISVRNY